MKYLFHFNTFNDIDHMTPVVWKFLEKGEAVDVIFLSDYDFNEDYRIVFLSKYKKFRVYRVSFFQKVRNKLFFNTKSRALIKKYKIYKYIIEFISENLWKNSYLKKRDIKAVIYEWGTFRLNLDDAIQQKTPTIVLPHGLNIFKNYDINNSISERKKNSGNWPDFANRDIFDVYVVQSERHKKWCIDWGQSPEKVEVWGSARFYPPWSALNLKLCGDMKRNIPKNLMKVVFFLPHWSYNVKVEKVITLLDKISSLSYVHLFIKGHTRGSGTILDEHIKAIGQKNNIEFDVKEHSPQLISYSDIVINFGSSIAIDALNMDTPSIHAPYLHSNRTIFDDGLVNYVADSDEEVIAFIDKNYSSVLSLPDKERKNLFYFKEVYGAVEEVDVHDSYYKNIKNIASLIPIK